MSWLDLMNMPIGFGGGYEKMVLLPTKVCSPIEMCKRIFFAVTPAFPFALCLSPFAGDFSVRLSLEYQCLCGGGY